MDERKPWEQLIDEPMRWFRRFEQYRQLPDRTVQGSFNRWRLEKSRKISTSTPKTWRDAAVRYRWKERAEAWDKHCLAQAAATIEARRIEILSSGYALQHKRVEALNELAELLLQEIQETDKRWLPDVKSIGLGKTAERVDIVRFNGSLIEQARKALEDIADELGERVQKIEGSIQHTSVNVIVDK